MKRQKKRLCALLCTILLLNTLVLGFAQSALAASYRQGDSGSAVTTIQTKLKRWGYFDGPVDGVYGSKTTKAVRSFQQKNGLTADGVAGPATLKALGMEQTSPEQRQQPDRLQRRERQRGRGTAGQSHLGRGPRGTLRRPGGRGRSHPEPHRPPPPSPTPWPVWSTNRVRSPAWWTARSTSPSPPPPTRRHETR